MSFPVEILKALSHCPVCHKEYKPAKLSILAEKEGKTLLHVTCEMCQVSSIVSATATPGGAICMGLLTDLASLQVNVLNVHHDRAAEALVINQVDVDVQMATRGPKQREHVQQRLTELGYVLV